MLSGRKPAQKRVAKRDFILAKAAQYINSQGIGGIILGDLADKIGIPRKTLYYYVADRDDLIFQCYHRACIAMDESLAIANDEAEGAADRIRLFVETSLNYDAPAQVAISDVEYISDAKQAVIREQLVNIVAHLRAMIDDGIAQGALRACDSEIAAHLVLGMMNWTRIASDWFGLQDTRTSRHRSARAITRLFLTGLSIDPDANAECTIDIEDLQARLHDPFDRKQLIEIKADQIAATASNLFNRHGIEATSLDNVVAVLGMSKSAIYHYFAGKNELIAACYKRAFRLHELFLGAADPHSDGLARISTAIHLLTQAHIGSVTPLVPQPGWASLIQEEQVAIARSIRRVAKAGNRIYRTGAFDGSLRKVDIQATGSAFAGVMLWLPKWITARDKQHVMQIADEVTGILVRGLMTQRPSEAA